VNASSVVSGLLLGGVYALIALGLSLVFGVLRMINLAHGSILIGGAYLALFLTQRAGFGLAAAIPVVVLAVFAVSYLLQRGLLSTLLMRDRSGPLVATFGLALVLEALYTAAYSSNPQSLRSWFATSGFVVAGLHLRTAYLIGFAVAAAACAAVQLGLARTRTGAQIRAAAVDPATAQLAGINVRLVYAVTFAVATALSAIAGVLVGATFSITPDGGTAYLLIGFAVVALGGVGSIAGTFVAALAVGVIQTVGAAVFGGGYADLCVYVALLAALTIRPTGLFGRRGYA
jgi:branched-chain amino acid transport system permease protein